MTVSALKSTSPLSPALKPFEAPSTQPDNPWLNTTDLFEGPKTRRHVPVTAADVTNAASKHEDNVELVKQAADRYGVPRDLALAVAFSESKFDENAGSPTGVKGVMQVTKASARRLGLDRDDNAQNIDAGMQLLKDAIDRAGSDRDYATLAKYYNGSSPGQQAAWALSVKESRAFTPRL